MSSSDRDENVGSQNAVRANVSGSIPTTVTVVSPSAPAATNGRRITFVVVMPESGGGGKSGPGACAAICAPVETNTLFSVEVRIVATAMPA